MKKYGLLVVSALLVHSAGYWVYIFFIVLQRGKILIGEPNQSILMAEVVMSVVWTLVGIFFLIWATLELFNFRIGQKNSRR